MGAYALDAARSGSVLLFFQLLYVAKVGYKRAYIHSEKRLRPGDAVGIWGESQKRNTVYACFVNNYLWFWLVWFTVFLGPSPPTTSNS